MLTVGIILVVLWALGFLTSYTLGGLIHILLVLAVIVLLANVIQGRRLSPEGERVTPVARWAKGDRGGLAAPKARPGPGVL